MDVFLGFMKETVMDDTMNYDNAVKIIKNAILRSQYEAAKDANEKQLMLYYGIGKYISLNSRNGFWGKGAIETISERLDRELPGLRGFTSRNLRYMRTFYEEWSMLDTYAIDEKTGDNSKSEIVTSKLVPSDINSIWKSQFPNLEEFPLEEFFHIGFTHHGVILGKVKNIEERIYYIKRCSTEHYSVENLKKSIAENDYQHQGNLPNNFLNTLTPAEQAFRAVNTFKDEYLLDFINVEEIGIRDKKDINERVVENTIVHNVKNFMMTFGKGFSFISNQYHLEAFGEDQYVDLLFFNRNLNCLVAVELKTGKFKTSYLGELQGYLSVLDGFERKPHENPAIGLILCKDMNKSFVDYVIQDYDKPMGVATYKTSKDMSDELKAALPDIDILRKLLDTNEDDDD